MKLIKIRYKRTYIIDNYDQIQHTNKLSKNGQEKETLNIMRSMIANNQLFSELHHEVYGWIIYRYIKSIREKTTSIKIRTLLKDYMNLKNKRPSLLHSTILNFALSYSKQHSDFNFYNFLICWNPTNLRHEDLHNNNRDGKIFQSLISRICTKFVNTRVSIDIEKDIIEKDIIEKDNLNRETILDLFREPYFWNLYKVNKEKRIVDLWKLFNEYNITYSKYGKSKWHSEILKIAERFMKENELWRFFEFFKKWDPNNFMDSDWKEEKGKNGEKYKPLAVKAIKKAFESMKNRQDIDNSDLSWLINIYDKAMKLFPEAEWNDKWFGREKALLYIRQKDFDSAINIYKKLILELGDKYYVWQEFAECFNSDNQLRIGMLSKALSLEKNEDFLDDIHLKLAVILINEKLLENALFELETYKIHRENINWKLSAVFETLYSKAKTVLLNTKDNRKLYSKYIPFAEDFAYQDIDWTELVVVDRYKNENRKEKILLSNGNSIELSIWSK